MITHCQVFLLIMKTLYDKTVNQLRLENKLFENVYVKMYCKYPSTSTDGVMSTVINGPLTGLASSTSWFFSLMAMIPSGVHSSNLNLNAVIGPNVTKNLCPCSCFCWKQERTRSLASAPSLDQPLGTEKAFNRSAGRLATILYCILESAMSATETWVAGKAQRIFEFKSDATESEPTHVMALHANSCESKWPCSTGLINHYASDSHSF